MADNRTGLNAQYSGADPLGGPGGYGSTGAAGSPAAVESDALPDSDYNVAVSIPGATSQGDVPVIGVGRDDVNQPGQTLQYGAGADRLTGIGAGQGETGAGQGHAGHFTHPNSVNRGGAA